MGLFESLQRVKEEVTDAATKVDAKLFGGKLPGLAPEAKPQTTAPVQDIARGTPATPQAVIKAIESPQKITQQTQQTRGAPTNTRVIPTRSGGGAPLQTIAPPEDITRGQTKPLTVTPAPEPEGSTIERAQQTLTKKADLASQKAIKATARGDTLATLGYRGQEFGVGVAQGVLGAAAIVRHPVKTIKGIAYASTNPLQTGRGIGTELKERPAAFFGEIAGGFAVGAGISKAARAGARFTTPRAVATGAKTSTVRVKNLVGDVVDVSKSRGVVQVGREKFAVESLGVSRIRESPSKGISIKAGKEISQVRQGARIVAIVRGESAGLVKAEQGLTIEKALLKRNVKTFARSTPQTGFRTIVTKGLTSEASASVKSTRITNSRKFIKSIEASGTRKIGERPVNIGISEQQGEVYSGASVGITGKQAEEFVQRVQPGKASREFASSPDSSFADSVRKNFEATAKSRGQTVAGSLKKETVATPKPTQGGVSEIRSIARGLVQEVRAESATKVVRPVARAVVTAKTLPKIRERKVPVSRTSVTPTQGIKRDSLFTPTPLIRVSTISRASLRETPSLTPRVGATVRSSVARVNIPLGLQQYVPSPVPSPVGSPTFTPTPVIPSSGVFDSRKSSTGRRSRGKGRYTPSLLGIAVGDSVSVGAEKVTVGAELSGVGIRPVRRRA